MNNYNENYSQIGSSTSLDSYVSAVMRKVYVKMFLALLITAATAWYVATSPALTNFFFGSLSHIAIFFVVEIVTVLALTFAMYKVSTPVAKMLFYLFAIINGITFSVIFYAYTMSSIAYTFAITAGVFGAMSLYGYFTKNDLTRFGTFLLMGLIGLLICLVVNLFVASSTLEWIISFVGVAVFVGLTAWDTQRIKNMAATTSSSNVERVATLGALSLYLDLINLFWYLLRFFGNSRD